MKAASGRNARRQKQVKVLQYIMECGGAARQEIAVKFGFSMPTTIQLVQDLMEKGWIYEAGEYDSTGGRKAKILNIQENARYAIGMELRKNEIVIVLMDLGLNIIALERRMLPYDDRMEYYEEFGKCIRDFIHNNALGENEADKLTGIGLSIPGIINRQFGVIQQSHILQVKDVDLNHFTRSVPYKMYIENDANNAAFAEAKGKFHNVVYLSLSDTVGGAIYLNGEIYEGDNYKSAEIGHMIMVPGGRTCYCGKKGCVDAYCSAKRLRGERFEKIDDYFESLKNQDLDSIKVWDEYLEYLALACGNLRVLFDCDIFLGGDVGGYIKDYQMVFEEKLKKYSNFDYTMSFVHAGAYKYGSAAAGAARRMLYRYLDGLDEAGGWLPRV